MVAISVVILVVHSLAFYCFGVFLKPITSEFGWDRGAISAAYSMSVLVAGGIGILSGRLTDKYGPRPIVTIGGLLVGIALLLLSQINSLWHVYLIWGTLMGIGSSFWQIPVIALIPVWFTKRRGIAAGITMAGKGLGGIISPLLAQWLISAYGWRYTFITLGIITLVFIISLAQFMKQSPQRAGLNPYGVDDIIVDEQSQGTDTQGISLNQALKTSQFWLFGLVLASVFFCLGTIMVHIVPHARDIGISGITAASMLSIAAGISILGRLGIGFLYDRIGGRLTLIICLGLLTLALLWLMFIREIWMFYVFALLFGLSYGGFITLLPVVAAELFGIVSLGVIIGGLTLMSAIGDSIGAPVTGSIFDITGSYNLAFLSCVVICAIATILSLILLKHKGEIGKVRE
jgi:MFS family permease